MIGIDLTGRKALVTGSSQGIGESICRHLAMCGADVMINYYQDKDKKNADLILNSIVKKYQVKAYMVKADISKSIEVKDIFLEMDRLMGGIDVLVNNAGYETLAHVTELEESDWDGVLDTCLKGAFLCIKEAVPRMEKIGKGVIINITSIHDIVPRKGLVHYCAAKAGLNMLSKCLSLELAQSNIRVVSVGPGAIKTEMNKDEIEKLGSNTFQKWIPQGRIGEVEEIANTVAFLASDLASYINGASIYVDGSYSNSTIQYDPSPARSNKL